MRAKLRHIQTDLLQPTQQELEILYPKVRTCFQNVACFRFSEVAAVTTQT